MPILFALRTDALAVASEGSITPAKTRTDGLSAFNLTLSAHLLNETLTPSQNFISYPVSHSSTTLEFHGFGPTIPSGEFLQAVSIAVGIAFDYTSGTEGKKPITSGFFEYSHEFLNRDEIIINVADFREIGRTMTYFVLWDTLRGIGEFVLLRGQRPQEMQFEVEVEKLGYLATGHVGYKPAAASMPGVA